MRRFSNASIEVPGVAFEVIGTPDIALEGALVAVTADPFDIDRRLAATMRLGDKAGPKTVRREAAIGHAGRLQVMRQTLGHHAAGQSPGPQLPGQADAAKHRPAPDARGRKPSLQQANGAVGEALRRAQDRLGLLEIGRAHVLTPVTSASRMPSSA